LGHHHGLLLLKGGSGGMAVGMETGREAAVGLFECGGVDIECGLELE
jgi:hypothetical protein